MNLKSKRTLTPKLRFPEFRDKGDWEAQPLDRVSQFVKKKIPLHQLNLDTYVSTENLSPDYGGIEQASKLPPNGSATEYKPDDILIANIRPYLKKVWRSNRSGGASNDVIVIRPKTVLRNDYLPMVIANDAFINYVMTTVKGVKMPRGDIASIKDYIVHYPTLPEQQKIAECLGSLDGVIAAEGRKLAGLRDHKRGLMQQLFPGTPTSSSAGGERAGGDAGAPSQPRLRFPEFRDKGGWEEKKAGSLFSQRKEKGQTGLPIYSVTINDGMVLRSTFDRNFYDIEDPAGNKKARKNDIAYNMMRMWQGACGVAPEDCMVSPAYVVLKPKKGTCPAFFDVLFKRPAILHLLMAYSRGLTLDRLRLYFDDFTSIPLLVPTEPEQQRIAECLTALDALITAQAAKTDALKQHKRGLMQQLFPAPEEVEA